MSELKRKNLNDYPASEVNPSLEKKLHGINIGEVKLEGLVQQLVDEADGSVLKQYTLLDNGSRRVLDKLEFIKLYVDSWDYLPVLSNAGLRLLVHIFKIVKMNRDSFSLSIEDACKACGYKNVASLYLAIIDLLENKFIFKKVGRHEYFLNVNMIFNGKRTALEPLRKLQGRLDEAKKKDG